MKHIKYLVLILATLASCSDYVEYPVETYGTKSTEPSETIEPSETSEPNDSTGTSGITIILNDEGEEVDTTIMLFSPKEWDDDDSNVDL